MTPQELKNSILQLAIQGKLVEQRPEEGTAEELYQQIQNEKQRLFKEGKIKKEKPLPEITEDEIPFDIPDSWMWVRLANYCTEYFSGKSPVYSKVETPYKVIGQAANQQRGIDLSQIKYTTYDFWNRMEDKYFLRENDVLLNTLGNGTLGRSGIIKNLTERLLTDGHLFVFRTKDPISSEFLYYYFQLKRTEIEKAANGSTNQTFLSLGNTTNWMLPLPPLAEQKRIVAKIEELLPYIDRYEAAWTKLEDFNKRFPVDMQKSILQYAIQGKLVEQCPEEGTGEDLYQQIQKEKQRLIKEGKIKKEKPLPEITEDEIPFDIPESWKTLRFGSVITLLSGTDFKPEEYNECNKGTVYITGASCLSDDGVIECRWTETPRIIAEKGDVLLVCKGSGYGKTVICNIERAHIARQIMAIKKTKLLDMLYIRYYLMANLSSIKENGQGVIPGIDRGSVLNMVFPLPPLAEQKRIVAKLEEILPLCEKLK